ncbi:MAG: hypothetical protein JST51_07535 [Armatimonadetes bacterium]|nr:hypothetical protein [Armatimonadota bacterium]
MLATLLSLALAASPVTNRWFYMQTNLAVADNALEVVHVMDRAHLAGYNGMVLTDSKFSHLDSVPDGYFANAAKVKAKAAEFGIEIIPVVADVGWSDGLLSHDVNLVEGQPVKKAPFVVEGGKLKPVHEIQFNNGGLEEGQDNHAAGFTFQDGPGTSTFFDSNVKHGGRQSMRFEHFHLGSEAGNARLMHGLALRPWQQYRITFWLKTDGVKNAGDIRCFVMGVGGRVLDFMDVGAKPTEDWTQHTIVFNSQDFSKATLYVGIWGGSEGRFWVDDIDVQEAGFLNVLRRPGTPVRLETEDGKTLVEGKDFDPVKDPNLGVKPWAGEYTFDQATPLIKTSLPEGSKVFASFTHAVSTDSGKTAICPSEPKSMELIADQIKRVADLWKPKSLFLAHDEIRVADQCPLCRSRGLTPGQIYAENLRQCIALSRKTVPNCRLFVWSDMFDPAHNAVDDYYLSNGTWKESWKGLSPEVTVVNWNSGNAAKSLPFFDSLGCKQILAGFYDGPVGDIKKWQVLAAGTKGVDGVMYTTWRGDYTHLEEFAEAAFSGG